MFNIKRKDCTQWLNEQGEFHRLDGPAVEYKDGTKEWWANGKRHREDGPAIIDNNAKEWWVNDKRHCLDGPAIEWAHGAKSWWINGECCSEIEFPNKVIMFLLNCNEESVKLVSKLFAYEI